ncbi:MAG TPA: hypothetical protein VNN73_11490 [Blastocatellia bacterium]|nr:hypothetical protein [Blastocatellia bacterium]
MAIRTTRNVHRSIQSRNHGTSRTTLDPNDLKSVVRDGLVSMTMAEREEFIQVLEAEMRRANLNMRAYLIPLGIPGRSPEDLTPTEVGHLVRFLKINVPQAMPAVERAMARFGVFAEKAGQDRLAA